MKPYVLSRTQLNNLRSCQDDINCIDEECLRASKAGVAVDAELESSLTDCRDRLFRILQNYTVTENRKLVNKNEQLSE